MRDAKKYAASRMGIATSSIPGHILPKGEIEDTCPLCGRFSPLDKRGYCGEEQCNDAARQAIRVLVKENGGENIPGMYYKFGDQEIFMFAKLETWEEPKATKPPDMCVQGECTEWALPADSLCKHHKLAEKREEMQNRRRPGTTTPKKPRKQKRKSLNGNKIRGLDRIKL